MAHITSLNSSLLQDIVEAKSADGFGRGVGTFVEGEWLLVLVRPPVQAVLEGMASRHQRDGPWKATIFCVTFPPVLFPFQSPWKTE